MSLVALLACLERPWHCRYAAGALNLASPEVKIKLADEGEANAAIDVKMYELLETNMMVEEMMLMANITVGTHIHGKYPSCAVLRRHEAPTPERLEPLLQVPLPLWSSRSLVHALRVPAMLRTLPGLTLRLHLLALTRHALHALMTCFDAPHT